MNTSVQQLSIELIMLAGTQSSVAECDVKFNKINKKPYYIPMDT